MANVWWVAVLLSGCAEDDPLSFARTDYGLQALTGSSTVVLSEDGDWLFAVDPVSEALGVWDLVHDEVTTLDLPGEPTRITVLGSNMLGVSLRADRSVATFILGDDGPTPYKTVEVGAEPYGLVTARTRDRVYVALSLEGRVDELDAVTLEPLRSWRVADQPRWLAIHPSENALYVGSAHEGRLTWIDLVEGTKDQLVLQTTYNTGDHQDPLPRAPRITGDLSVASDGSQLAVPVQFVDVVPADSQLTTAMEMDMGVGLYFQGSNTTDPGRDALSPAVVTFPLADDGRPHAQAQALSLVQVLEFDDNRFSARSYPTAVRHSADGETLAVTMEAADTVIALPRSPTNGTQGAGSGISKTDSHHSRTCEGPVGLAADRFGGFWLWCELDRRVMPLDDWLDGITDRWNQPRERFRTMTTERPTETTELVPWRQDPDVEAGRRLFHSVYDPGITNGSSGLSCSGCHFDTRTDGLSWQLEGRSRQTLSLAGQVSLTEPVTWEGDVPTVEDEATLGARRLNADLSLAADADVSPFAQIAAWIDFTRHEDVPEQDSDTVDRGNILFHDPVIGCAECHPSPLYTDNLAHEIIRGDPTITPSLVGVMATAPYLSDGSEPDLEGLLWRFRDGEMGDTSALDEGELADLEAFLRSL